MEKIYDILFELKPEYDFYNSKNFISDGLLDSFDIADLIDQLEKEFQIGIDAMDILPEYFESATAIAELVKKSGWEKKGEDAENNELEVPFLNNKMVRLTIDYLDRTCSVFPNKTAFDDEQGEMTFSEVRENARRIAMGIVKKNIFKKPIVVFLDKCVNVVITFLGITYSGNFYSPVDVKMPESRVRKIIETLRPELLITDRMHEGQAKKLFDKDILLIEELMNNKIDEQQLLEVRSRIVETDLLYVLFTSGSTGTPKGVTISHRAIIDYTEWVTNTFGIDETHIFGNQAPFYFDNSVLDIYQTLKTGAKMCIIPEKYFSFPAKLLQYMDEKKVNTIFWVPSALCLVANYHILERLHLKELKKILFAGEVMPIHQLNMWRKEYESCLFANLYGPTEIGVDCTYYIVNREFQDNESLPIGVPCENTDIIVLDEENRLVTKRDQNKEGELCVRGCCLSYGYYGDEQKTNQVFVQNPLNTDYREIIYRTGDIVKYNDREELIYLGRKDSQIKYSGHRIELGEIEAAVSSIGQVETNCCIYNENKQQIILFFTGDMESDNLKKILVNLLPDYMLPHKIFKEKSLPLSPNGKIDRQKLKQKC